MDINKINTQVLDEETRLGIYVWEMPDGRWVGDDEGNFLSVTSMREALNKMEWNLSFSTTLKWVETKI